MEILKLYIDHQPTIKKLKLNGCAATISLKYYTDQSTLEDMLQFPLLRHAHPTHNRITPSLMHVQHDPE